MTTPKEWKKLTPYGHSRLRTEMYLGSRDPHTQVVLEYGPQGPFPVETVWVPALFTAFREVLDNALDEVAAHGHGDRIDITFDPKSLIVSVKDNGRGIPIDFDKTEKKHAATVLLSETLAGRNFEDDRGATRGLNGVGASIVNFCSEFFQVDIVRDNKEFSQRFVEGTEHIAEDPMIIPRNTTRTGTRIEFKLSSIVFRNRVLPENFIKARVHEAALCYPKLKLTYNGKSVVVKSVEKDLFPKHTPITFSVEDEGFKSNFWLVPKFFADGSEYSHSLVNAIPVFNGGVHIETFKKNFFAGMIGALDRESKKRKLVPNKSDLSDGMLIYNITEMKAPEFDSQSKTRLINEGVAKILAGALDAPDFFKSVIRKNPEWIESVYESCAERTQKKDDKDTAKKAKEGKRAKVEKLKDATSYDRSKCILFLGEGDSAISGLNEARNPVIHGGLPLRGKVMNVHGMRPKEAYANAELTNIMNTIGLVAGQRANRHALRYGKVYIATDADSDGYNIAALVVNFFYHFWPELFDDKNPFLFVFQTPLIIAVKGKNRKYWYAEEYDSFEPKDFSGWDVTRAKGLAALKRTDWAYVLENPKTVPIYDDGSLTETLSLLFDSKRSQDRKGWIGM